MLLRMGLLLRLGPNVITDGTFITLGSNYYTCAFYRVSNKFFGMRDFPYLRLGIRGFKAAKSGRDSGLKVCAGGGMLKVTLGITGLPEILGRDHGIEKPYWGPSYHARWLCKLHNVLLTDYHY